MLVLATTHSGIERGLFLVHISVVLHLCVTREGFKKRNRNLYEAFNIFVELIASSVMPTLSDQHLPCCKSEIQAF